MRTAIEIRGVDKSFGTVRAPRRARRTGRRRRALALGGPNGAGKSLLISVVAGRSRAKGYAIRT
jgi:ABC-type sugar transport system ATPase subunit